MEEFQVKMSLNDILSQILKIPAPKNQKNGAMLQFQLAKRYWKKKQKRYVISKG